MLQRSRKSGGLPTWYSKGLVSWGVWKGQARDSCGHVIVSGSQLQHAPPRLVPLWSATPFPCTAQLSSAGSCWLMLQGIGLEDCYECRVFSLGQQRTVLKVMHAISSCPSFMSCFVCACVAQRCVPMPVCICLCMCVAAGGAGLRRARCTAASSQLRHHQL